MYVRRPLSCRLISILPANTRIYLWCPDPEKKTSIIPASWQALALFCARLGLWGGSVENCRIFYLGLMRLVECDAIAATSNLPCIPLGLWMQRLHSSVRSGCEHWQPVPRRKLPSLALWMLGLRGLPTACRYLCHVQSTAYIVCWAVAGSCVCLSSPCQAKSLFFREGKSEESIVQNIRVCAGTVESCRRVLVASGGLRSVQRHRSRNCELLSLRNPCGKSTGRSRLCRHRSW
jgi:hypothetical protein